MAHRFPPIDFPLYGLDSSWSGPRWLDFFQGRVGAPVWMVSLGHGPQVERVAGRTWAMVASYSRQRFDLFPHGTLEEALGFEAARLLLDRTRDVDRMQAEAGRWASWPTAAWAVDGRRATAHLIRYDDAWAAFTTGPSDVGLVVHASGLLPDGLALARTADPAAYHFDPGSPLYYPTAIETSQAAAFRA